MSWRIRAAAASTFVLLLTGCTNVTTSPTLAASPVPGPTQEQTMLRGSSQYGVAAGDVLPGRSPAELGSYFNKVSELGAHWVRFDAKWSDAQPAAGSGYDWSSVQPIMDSASAHGLGVYAILDSTPRWAASSECHSKDPFRCPAVHPQDYAKFALAFLRAFPNQEVVIEAGNETNYSDSYGARPKQYVELLKSVYEAVQPVFPGVEIMPAGTGAIGKSSADEGIEPVEWYDKLFALGAGKYVSGANVHPYTFPTTPGQLDLRGNWVRIEQVHDVLTKYGYPRMRVDVTEMGFPTRGAVPATHERYPRYAAGQPVTEARQADFFADSLLDFRRIQTEGVGGRFFVYSLFDQHTGQADVEANFGLMRSNGQPKPAFATVQNFIKKP